MPGNVVIRGSGAGAAPPSDTPPTAKAATTTPRTAPNNRGVGFRVWQPSFGPGSPQTPFSDIARAAKTKSPANVGGPTSRWGTGIPTAQEAAAMAAAEGGVAGGFRRGNGVGRGRGAAKDDGMVGPMKSKSAGDVFRGSRAQSASVPTRGGEWEGGDSDEASSDEEDDLVLQR